ncbi:MAG: class I SAM-dependent methyltransferase [Prolixibacteraceae bacterium]|jgi:2-polyprenyl-3-methyl-5-hydroxy-6-metoxy-1,4-benzoquinol methylase
MENTGERHILDEDISDEAEYYNHLMHIATYQFALKYVKGKRVLDYGCGSGYGSYMLSDVADNVTAVDISDEAILFAKSCYNANNLVFNSTSELLNEKYDVITSFQVIEHVVSDKEYIEKLKNLLNPEGCLLISTPDKNVRLFNYIQKPWNIFHLKEYTSNGLLKLLQNYFDTVEVLKIGSDADFIVKEISRTKKQRLLTLPCTLFFYPNFLRIFLLNFQVRIYNAINKYRKNNKVTPKNSKHSIDFKTKHSINDINIAANMEFSTDLLAICLKS